MKTILLAARDFAVPVPRTGSIETHSGYGRAAAEGQEIHQRIQRAREAYDSSYRAEVAVEHDFERGGYRFTVGGRMDGFFEAEPPRIEEIKSSFNHRELVNRLEAETDHPYRLQLRTYGYIHWIQNQTVPRLSFHLVSTRNGDSDDLNVPLDLPSYEAWLDRRLDELVEEAKKSEKRVARRKKLADKFLFPFERARSGQIELIHTVEEGMQAGQRMLLQAPTGLGKTVGTLYPSLKEAMSRGQKVVYVTPKNSQHSVAEDAIARFQDTGTAVKSLTITAKSKICFKAEPLCNPDYCEYAKDYYSKVHENKLVDTLAKKKKLSAKVFRAIGEEHQVCPFELQLDVARESDAVICDYNYVFAPRSAFGRIAAAGLGQEGKPNLVIDEAHNLPARAMDYYSPELSSATLEKIRQSVRELSKRHQKSVGELIDECIQTIIDCRPDGASKASKIDPPLDPFLDQDGKLRAFLSRYLESDQEIQPRDPVLKLCFYWAEFTAALAMARDPARKEFFTSFKPHPTGGTVKITCCDASKMLELCYDEYQQVVGFSATLKPFDYYAKLSGLDLEKIRVAEFQSPFAKSNRKLLIIPQISTKYSERDRNYPRIAETIQRIAAIKPGNYFAFFPSFHFIEKVLEHFQPPPGFVIIRQERDMRAPEIEEVVDHLRGKSAPTLVFAVQGGVFSEGVDYPGETIIGAFIVGPPLPIFDLEREEMRRYYETNRAPQLAFEYAYVYPAMAKSVQAAGRVIRSETDRGLIVLMDGRFIQSSYSQSMPSDWFDKSPRELVSSSILKEVTDFWSESELAQKVSQSEEASSEDSSSPNAST